MNIKKCGKCGQTKNVCEFTKDKNRIDGLFVYCKLCKKEASKKEYEKNKVRILEYQKKYYSNHHIDIKKRLKKDYLEKKEDKLEYQKVYYLNNLTQKLEYAKEYRQSNKEKRNTYENFRKQNDLSYKIKHLVRNRVLKFLKIKNYTKKHKTFQLVGCSPLELKIYLEQKFIDGMSWENQGKWHIDHIIPLSSAINEEELYKLCHFTNLQPMWATDNIRKGAKII